MQRFQDILVCIDVLQISSVPSDPMPAEPASALAHAAWVAQQSGGKVSVMTVLPDPVDEALIEQAREILTDKARAALGSDPVQVSVAVGTPFLEITRAVMRNGHDLVVVAARKRSLLERRIVGSSALKLVRKCPCPVWVAPRRFAGGPHTVLSAAGFHGITATILELSSSLVKLTGGEWHVVHCMEYPKEGAMRLRGTPAEEIEAYKHEAREFSWKKLHEFTDPFKAATGIDPKLWLAQGCPDAEIAMAAQQTNADVLVMGTVGRSGIPGLLVGNTAEKLLQLVECSVLTVKPEGFVSPVADEG